MAFDFPNTPTIGLVYTTPTGVAYTWDGEKWGAGAGYGIGAVLYSGPQGLTRDQQAQARSNTGVTKKNYILNGGMQISQENGATAVSADGTFPVDLFVHRVLGTTGAINTAQVAVVTPAGSPNRLRSTVTTADAAVAAGDAVFLSQHIEGLRVADLLFGTSSAKTVTLQFGVKAPAGTYCVVVENGGANRSYVAEYVIAAGEANTDVIKSVTIAGDTAGTWLKDNGIGLRVRWGLMAGSTFQQAAGSWGTADAIGSSNQFNLMATVGNVFELFDVGLYEGNVAPPFQVPDYPSELALCQRYWQKYTQVVISTIAPQAGTWYGDFTLAAVMRAAVTPALSGITYANASGATSNASQVNHQRFSVAASAAGAAYTIFDFTCNARL